MAALSAPSGAASQSVTVNCVLMEPYVRASAPATSSMMVMSVFITSSLAASEEPSCAAPTSTPVVITRTVRRGFSIGYATSPDSSALRCAVMPSGSTSCCSIGPAGSCGAINMGQSQTTWLPFWTGWVWIDRIGCARCATSGACSRKRPVERVRLCALHHPCTTSHTGRAVGHLGRRPRTTAVTQADRRLRVNKQRQRR